MRLGFSVQDPVPGSRAFSLIRDALDDAELHSAKRRYGGRWVLTRERDTLVGFRDGAILDASCLRDNIASSPDIAISRQGAGGGPFRFKMISIAPAVVAVPVTESSP